MSDALSHARTSLALTEDPLEDPIAAPWIGSLVALGVQLSRYAAQLAEGRQLVVMLSVPQRSFAAALIGCGWMMNSEPPDLAHPLHLFRSLHAGTPVRVVTPHEVIADRFQYLDETKSPPRVRLGASQWVLTALRAAAELGWELEEPVRSGRPDQNTGGVISRLSGSWDSRLAAPADLAIVGTLKWIHEDIAAWLTTENEAIAAEDVLEALRATSPADRPDQYASIGGRITDLLLPDDRKHATWFTKLFPSAQLAEELPLPDHVRAVLLDGASAMKFVSEIATPIVLCVVDRSVADESAVELVVQLRNSRGEPVSLREDLRWHPPCGVEALAFTVPL